MIVSDQIVEIGGFDQNGGEGSVFGCARTVKSYDADTVDLPFDADPKFRSANGTARRESVEKIGVNIEYFVFVGKGF